MNINGHAYQVTSSSSANAGAYAWIKALMYADEWAPGSVLHPAVDQQVGPVLSVRAELQRLFNPLHLTGDETVFHIDIERVQDSG